MGSASHFLEGREAYLSKTPFYQITERLDALDRDSVHSTSFLCGFLDGALGDLRDCAQNAREEMAARRS